MQHFCFILGFLSPELGVDYFALCGINKIAIERIN